FGSAQDHKRVGEGDTGPNTGGMGAYAPPALATPELRARVQREILEPTAAALVAAGRPYRGVLYAGLMVTAEGPKVLEFNCRFGDPETQVILPLLASDLLDIVEAVVAGHLEQAPVRWRAGAACGVVLAAQGYPGPYPTGMPIRGLDTAPDDALVFHAGTRATAEGIVAAGGRVLTVVGQGPDRAAARERAYAAVAGIQFEGCYYRRDIAAAERGQPAAAG
ncbi:MAG TPA: phosphoribosylglycinamide synthetase C domain-containing protein, partial [Chloroflexota bacterium]|nr:phosphoribosylglycinamide synthetase C domain-containing protein [Chloroflexota bacterium]